jgi:GNAT superfamily N-acetyltransferase
MCAPGDLAARARAFHRELQAAVCDVFEPLDYIGRSAEVAQVYLRADRRGRGLGTAVTRAAMDAAGDADELWIVGDDEGRPKNLYARLGFRRACTAVELLRLPDADRT